MKDKKNLIPITSWVCQFLLNSFVAPNQLVCTYCFKKICDKPSLKVHIRIHTQERPYKCTYKDCDKGFATSGNLRDHEKRHYKLK